MNNPFSHTQKTWDLTVVGGGLAGLTAATLAAKRGLSVILLEQSKTLGGRASTTRKDGISFNLGPHALYAGGETFKTLKSLGVTVQGQPPDQGEALLLFKNRFYTWPRSLPALLRSPLFTVSEKWQLARLPNRLAKLNPADCQNQSVADWCRQFAGMGNLARLIESLVTLSTFTNDPEYQSAGAAIEQLQLGNRGVFYLDHGWQSMVDGLRVKAESLGVTISTKSAVVRSVPNNNLIRTQRKDGTDVFSRSLILATSAKETTKLLDLPTRHPLAQRAENARPGLVASLDVALRQLPSPRRRFALGLDEPLYYSVHSAAAKMAPDGINVLHVMKYLGPKSQETPESTEQQLMRLLDNVQPGWQEHMVWQRFLPHMTAVSDILQFQLGGLAGRQPVQVEDFSDIFVAGDWVGDSGQLADAAVASACAAADRVAHSLLSPQQLELVS